MESPKELLEAARPGPPLDEKQKAKFILAQEPKFPTGFKGTHKLPEDYAKRAPRIVLTPIHWRRIGIDRRGERFALVFLYSRCAITKTDWEVLGLKHEKTEDLEFNEALRVGGILEAEFAQVAIDKTKKKRQRISS